MAVALPDELYKEIEDFLRSLKMYELLRRIDAAAYTCHDCRYEHNHSGGLE